MTEELSIKINDSIESYNVEALVQLLAEIQAVPGLDLNSILDKEGNPLLISAVNTANNGSCDIVKALIGYGNINVNVTGKNGKTALHAGVILGYGDIVKMLVEAKADCNLQDEDGQTVMCCAAHRGDVENVKLLLTVRADNGSTALSIAAENDHVETAKELITAGSDVNITDNSGQSALSKALENKHNDVVKLLVESGADTKITIGNERDSPLHVATREGWNEIAKMLIERGADLNTKNRTRDTPLLLAVSNKRNEIATMLIEAGAEVNTSDQFGLTALLWAVKEGMTEIVRLLIEKGADPDKNEDGRTALYLCASDGHAEIADLLIQGGGNVNFADKEGCSVMYKAAYCGHLEIVQSLISAGADLKKANNDGMDPLFAAVCNGRTEVVRVLLSLGADVNVICDYGTTPLYHAVAIGNLAIVEMLVDAGALNHPHKDGSSPFSKALDEVLIKKNDDHYFPMLLKFIRHGLNVDVASGKPLSYGKLLDRKGYRKGIFSPSFAIEETLQHHHHALWFHMLQDAYSDSTELVKNIVTQHPHLATVKDSAGRGAVDMAVQDKKAVINSILLWHGKYRISAGKPEHQSATCFVYKAVDESRRDADGNYIPVALKLMKVKAQFEREVNCRSVGFNSQFVLDIVAHYSPSDTVGDVEMPTLPTGGVLSKRAAESMYCVVMPLADRNLYVALKQERIVTNITEIRHIFMQLVKCVEHMHSMNILHGDLKTLNSVRVATEFKLIDLDASCRIGLDPVGAKSSSGYIPPEAVFVDEYLAVVKSEATAAKHGFEPLIAHPSFDIWSLGCLLYQMCANGKTLFQASLDDNLSDNLKDMDCDDSLWALAEWPPELKAAKLSEVTNPLAANLLSLMLSKEPEKRPSISRILSHPFLTGKQGTRLIGSKAEFDVFISYRVASDAHHAERLFGLLTARGIKVWWDKKCLEAGVDWEKGFCSGLVNSKAFVCLLSQGSVAMPGNKRQNFSLLDVESPCDNVLLEHRLALELREIGLIEKVFPIMIGEKDADSDNYAKFTAWPGGPHTHVAALETALAKHMDNACLGTPMISNMTVAAVVTEITKCQGAFIDGDGATAFERAADSIVTMLQSKPSMPATCSFAGKSHSPTRSSTVSKLREAVNVYSCDCSASIKLQQTEELLMATTSQHKQAQAIAAAEISRLLQALAEKDREIAEKNKLLEEKDKQIAEEDKEIALRAVEIQHLLECELHVC